MAKTRLGERQIGGPGKGLVLGLLQDPVCSGSVWEGESRNRAE